MSLQISVVSAIILYKYPDFQKHFKLVNYSLTNSRNIPYV